MSSSGEYPQILSLKNNKSRPRVYKSLEQDFIKIILTKDQERDKRNKEQMRIRKSGCIELDRTYYYTEKFNIALSLCGVLKITLYFSKEFSKAAAEAPWPLGETIVCFLGQESNLWSPVPQ